MKSIRITLTSRFDLRTAVVYLKPMGDMVALPLETERTARKTAGLSSGDYFHSAKDDTGRHYQLITS